MSTIDLDTFNESQRQAVFDSYVESSPLNSDPKFEKVVLHTISKLIVSIRRKLIPFSEMKGDLNIVLQFKQKSIRKSFDISFGRLAKDEKVGHSLEIRSRLAIFEVAQEYWWDLIFNVLYNSSIPDNNITPECTSTSFDVISEIADLRKRHNDGYCKTVDDLIAVKYDIAKISKRCVSAQLSDINGRKFNSDLYIFCGDCSNRFMESEIVAFKSTL